VCMTKDDIEIDIYHMYCINRVVCKDTWNCFILNDICLQLESKLYQIDCG